jgi:hypothetical protein
VEVVGTRGAGDTFVGVIGVIGVIGASLDAGQTLVPPSIE